MTDAELNDIETTIDEAIDQLINLKRRCKLNAPKAEPKEQATGYSDILTLCKTHGLPTGVEYIDSIEKTAANKLSIKELGEVLANIEKAVNSKKGVQNIEVYTFKCLHNAIKNKETKPYY